METRNYAYCIKDVMMGNFKYAWDQEQLWEKAKKKRVHKINVNDVKH